MTVMPDEPDELPPVDPDEIEMMDFSSSFLLAAWETERRPIEELYSVFARPRNDADRRAGQLAGQWGALDLGTGDEYEDLELPPGLSREEWRATLPGEVLKDEGRLLLEGLGGEDDMLYAAPTSNGHICHALLPNGGGGTSAPGPDGLHLSASYTRGSLVVYGLVGDEIASVDVVLDGETHSARMGENAFGRRFMEPGPTKLEAVVLHRRNGTSNRIPIGFREANEWPDDD
jgi:hypothetical protein